MPDHSELRTKLQTELARLQTELEAIAELNPASGDWVAKPDSETLGNPDPNDEADAVEEWNERRALMPQLEIRYRNLQRALAKFEAGTYGQCEICGEAIEPERLTANPAARTDITHRERESELPF